MRYAQEITPHVLEIIFRSSIWQHGFALQDYKDFYFYHDHVMSEMLVERSRSN